MSLDALDALDGLDEDPGYNPVLLPARTRADVVQERPAGGTPSEVADANPGLAAAVPATVGQSGPTPCDTATEVVQHNMPAPTDSKDDAGTGSGIAKGAEGGVGGAAVLGAAGPAMAGAGLRAGLGDGSGMEVPELAVLPTDI
jgi:hypothetical protein